MSEGAPQGVERLALGDGTAVRVVIEERQGRPVVDIRLMRRVTMAPALFPTAEGLTLGAEHLAALVGALQALGPQAEIGSRQ